MATSSNDTNQTESPDWLSITKKEIDNESSPLGMIKGKPLSYFDALTRNFVGNPNLFQANLGQFSQNFVVATGTASKVRIPHNLFSVNVNPDSATSAIAVGVYGATKVAPFKAITAASAVLALSPPRRGPRKIKNRFASQASNSLQRLKMKTSLPTWWGKLRERRLENWRAIQIPSSFIPNLH
jgi:hypothetical protein